MMSGSHVLLSSSQGRQLFSFGKRFALPLLGALLLLSAVFTPASGASRSQVLRPRESLLVIAHAWNTTPETLRWLNDMGPRDLAWSGQRLIVPSQQGIIAHTTVQGESPQSIANLYGMSLAQFLELNKLSPSAELVPGIVVMAQSERGLWLSKEVRKYTVREGDTIESISETFQVQASDVYTINDLRRGSTPDAGTTILLPERDIVERLGSISTTEAGLAQLEIGDIPSLTEKWVAVDLSNQSLTAYEGTKPVFATKISSGRAATPTVTGVFRIWAKVASQTMTGGSVEAGDYYNLPGVQWVSYFYKDYALHGAYWHNRFGTPMSHGCVNLSNDDAEWLYNWMTPENPGRGWYTTDKSDQEGTLVVVFR